MDYSAYTEDNIRKYNGEIPGLPWLLPPLFGRTVLFIIAWFVIINPLWFITVVLLSKFSWAILYLFLMYIPINVVFWILLGKFIKTGDENMFRMALFAQRNNFHFTYEQRPFDGDTRTKSVIKNPLTSSRVTGLVNDAPFNIFCTLGKGMYVILQLELPNSYPHIVLDSTSNDFIASNLLSIFPEGKELVLEGNFPDYFRVYSAGSPTESLQILSPELMARMIDYPKKVDIEIIEDKLHLILNYKTITEQDMKMLFDTAEQIFIDIGDTSSSSRVKFDSKSRI